MRVIKCIMVEGKKGNPFVDVHVCTLSRGDTLGAEAILDSAFKEFVGKSPYFFVCETKTELLTVNRRQVNHLLFDSEFRDKLSQVSTTCPSDEKLLMMYKDKLRWAKQKKKVLSKAGFHIKRPSLWEERTRKRSNLGSRSMSLKKKEKKRQSVPREKKRRSLNPKPKKSQQLPRKSEGDTRASYSDLTVIVED